MLERTYFISAIDGVFCLRMVAVHRPSFTFNQRYNLQRKN